MKPMRLFAFNLVAASATVFCFVTLQPKVDAIAAHNPQTVSTIATTFITISRHAANFLLAWSRSVAAVNKVKEFVTLFWTLPRIRPFWAWTLPPSSGGAHRASPCLWTQKSVTMAIIASGRHSSSFYLTDATNRIGPTYYVSVHLVPPTFHPPSGFISKIYLATSFSAISIPHSEFTSFLTCRFMSSPQFIISPDCQEPFSVMVYAASPKM
jgi:hypothetical protein